MSEFKKYVLSFLTGIVLSGLGSYMGVWKATVEIKHAVSNIERQMNSDRANALVMEKELNQALKLAEQNAKKIEQLNQEL